MPSPPENSRLHTAAPTAANAMAGWAWHQWRSASSMAERYGRDANAPCRRPLKLAGMRRACGAWLARKDVADLPSLEGTIDSASARRSERADVDPPLRCLAV